LASFVIAYLGLKPEAIPYSTAPQPIAASGGNDALFATRTSQRIQHITLSGQRPPLEKLFEPLF
jgi:hypothetical protein